MRPLPLFLLMVSLILYSCAASQQAGLEPAVSLEGTPSVSVPATPTTFVDWFPATATATTSPNLEPTATPMLMPGLDAQVFSDDFSRVENWSRAKTTSDGGNSIILNRNRLTLAANILPVTLSSLHTTLSLNDFYAEVTVSINRCFGPDTYGMLFRAGSEAYTYRFLLNCSGKARVERSQDGKTIPVQDWLPSGDAPPGAPGQVRMSVWAAGTEMRFFLNGRYQFSVTDPVFKSGGMGVYINAASPDGMNVSFSDLTVHSVNYASPTPTAVPSKTPTPTRTPRPTP